MFKKTAQLARDGFPWLTLLSWFCFDYHHLIIQRSSSQVKRCNFAESENGPPDPRKCQIGITRSPLLDLLSVSSILLNCHHYHKWHNSFCIIITIIIINSHHIGITTSGHHCYLSHHHKDFSHHSCHCTMCNARQYILHRQFFIFSCILRSLHLSQ